MRQEQQLLQRQQQSQGKMVEFKCGKMNKNDGETTVTPDPRKGKLTVKMDREDQLMHFIWTNREQGLLCASAPIFPCLRFVSPGFWVGAILRLFCVLKCRVFGSCAGIQEDDMIIFPGEATFG